MAFLKNSHHIKRNFFGVHHIVWRSTIFCGDKLSVTNESKVFFVSCFAASETFKCLNPYHFYKEKRHNKLFNINQPFTNRSLDDFCYSIVDFSRVYSVWNIPPTTWVIKIKKFCGESFVNVCWFIYLIEMWYQNESSVPLIYILG